MKLRTKTFTVLGVAMTCLILILYGLSSTILMDGFKKVEQRDIKEDIDRAQAAVTVEMAQLSSTTRDYSGWDDTYNFILDGNPDYISANLVNDTFISLHLNMMVYVNNSGGIVFKKEVDLAQGNETDFPQGFSDLLKSGCPLLALPTVDSYVSGIVSIPEGQMLVSAYPILDSLRHGPIHGTLIFGRNLNADELDHLSNVTQLTLSLFKFNDPNMPSDLKTARSSLTNESKTFVKPLDENQIAGYIQYNDVYGRQSLILKVSTSRDNYQQGVTTLRYFMTAVVIICIIVGVLIIALMEMFVLTRLQRLSSTIRSIGSASPNAKPLDIDGEDEFATLEKDLRGKLESLNIVPVQEVPHGAADKHSPIRSEEFPELKPGKVYYLDEQKAKNVFRVFSSLLDKGYEGLCLTRMAPSNVRKAANIEKTPVVWLSTTSIPDERTIEPSSVAHIHSTIAEFLTAAEHPVVLIEGVEHLIFVNNFRVVLMMLHSLYEKTITTDGVLIIALSKGSMAPAEWALLTKDMEEIALKNKETGPRSPAP